MLAVVSDTVQNGLYLALTALVVAGTQVLTSWWSNRTRDVKLDTIAATGQMTHDLVNNNMKIELTRVAELARWKADHEPSPENIRAAELAEKRLKEHDEKQAVADGNAVEKEQQTKG